LLLQPAQVLLVDNAGLRLETVPDHAETHDVEAALLQALELGLAHLVSVAPRPLLAHYVDPAEQPNPPELIDELAAADADPLHAPAAPHGSERRCAEESQERESSAQADALAYP
jgi:hypothetical protein